MKKIIKRGITCIVACLMILSTLLCIGCSGGEAEKTLEFYSVVSNSRECLDEVADDIYNYWYDAIYEDKYYGNINLAIAYALDDNEENISIIEDNEIKIHDLYKEIKDSEYSSEIKAVMQAYSEYYEFVINVSGSFSSFSASKETLKKALATALKNLELEL